MSGRSAAALFLGGLAVLAPPTLLRAYLLWPLPGSQELDSFELAYALDRWLPLTWGLGGVATAFGAWASWRAARRRRTRWLVAGALVLVAAAFVAAETTRASRVFREPETVIFATGTSEDLPAETMVLGVVSGDEAKAYPIRLLAYHHRVRDTLGGEPVLATYCTMCWTGKLLRPVARGQALELELLGAIRYNSLYRDTTSGTWWAQANGRAVAGPWKGETLPEIRSDQMTLGEWLELYPDSLVLQPDPASADGYTMFGFDTYDESRSKPDREVGWQWVVGVVRPDGARGYLFSELGARRLVQDRIGDLPLAVHLRADLVSHRVWDRRVGGRVVDLAWDEESDELVDAASGTRFGFDGVGRGGALEGATLEPVSSSVEFWHAFERFSGGELWEAPAGEAESLSGAPDAAAESDPGSGPDASADEPPPATTDP